MLATCTCSMLLLVAAPLVLSTTIITSVKSSAPVILRSFIAAVSFTVTFNAVMRLALTSLFGIMTSPNVSTIWPPVITPFTSRSEFIRSSATPLVFPCTTKDAFPPSDPCTMRSPETLVVPFTSILNCGMFIPIPIIAPFVHPNKMSPCALLIDTFPYPRWSRFP